MSNQKRLAPQRRRVPRKASGTQRPPSEKVVLRRLYFLNSERSKYAFLGFYPQRGYRAFFELVEARRPSVVLPPLLFPTMARHIPRLCEHLVRGEQYKCDELSFRVQTAANNSARVTFDRASITLKLQELEYIMRNLTTLANQLARYKLAEADVLTYAQSVGGATNVVPPSKEQGCVFVQYVVLFEEINNHLLP
jgi:hypothetical protein